VETIGAPEGDVLRALDGLEAALARNEGRTKAITARADTLRQALEAGTPLSEAVTYEDRPLIVELITETIEDLQQAGVELRRVEARALRLQGLTIEEVGRLFGVTRQRVSALLRNRPSAGPPLADGDTR
jgi:hypothetical protein